MVTSCLTIVYAIHALIIMKQLSSNKGRFGVSVYMHRLCFHDQLHLGINKSKVVLHNDNIIVYFLLVSIALFLLILQLGRTIPLILVLPVTEGRVGLRSVNNACWYVILCIVYLL